MPYLIFQRNDIGNGFWERLGFNVRDDLYYRNKAVIERERILEWIDTEST